MTRKYEYRRTLPHYQKDGRSVFVTFNTAARWQLPPEARDVVLECCTYIHGRTAALHALVVMPEHVHAAFMPLKDMDGHISIAEIMQNVKSVSSHKINRLLHRNGRVWQEERFD